MEPVIEVVEEKDAGEARRPPVPRDVVGVFARGPRGATTPTNSTAVRGLDYQNSLDELAAAEGRAAAEVAHFCVSSAIACSSIVATWCITIVCMWC